MTKFRISFIVFFIVLIVSVFFARAGRQTSYLDSNFFEAYSQMEQISHDFKTDCSTCHTLGKFWLTETGEKARKMMQYSVDLNLKCQDCHTSLNTYNEKGEFTKKWMFPLVENYKVQCLTCHHSSDNHFTLKGRKARIMLDYSIAKNFECEKCHTKGSDLNRDDILDFGVDEMAENDFPDISNKGVEKFEKSHNIDSLIVIKRY